jgi:hypothetical protein
MDNKLLDKVNYLRNGIDSPEVVYLSRRNLLSLLSKLDRTAAGDSSACIIVKMDNVHPVYPQSMPSIIIAAVEDDAYYTYREAGKVHPKDVP